MFRQIRRPINSIGFSLLRSTNFENQYCFLILQSKTVIGKAQSQFISANGNISSRNLHGLVVGVPKESLEGEHRVALTPPHVVKLVKAGATVNIEGGAGEGSGFTDAAFAKAGAKVVSSDVAWGSQGSYVNSL